MDRKWTFIEHSFYSVSGTLCATGISKMVFKEPSGKTIPPQDVFERAGLDPSELPADFDGGAHFLQLKESLVGASKL